MWILAAFIVVLVGYPLSIGPMAWVAERGYLPEAAETPLEVLYAPLGMLAKHVPTFRYVIEWYLEYWETAALTVSASTQV
jgi:hypothetical protein